MFNSDDITVILNVYGITEQAGKFLDWNKDSFEHHNVRVTIMTDSIFDVAYEWASVMMYPGKEKVLSVPKSINYGIKRTSGDGIIIKTDSDIVFSKEVIQQVKKCVCPGHGLVALCSNIGGVPKDLNSAWKGAKIRVKGRGACCALTKEDWFKLNGLDERMSGWGAEDYEMFMRGRKRLESMRESQEFPLYHISHPVRKGNTPIYPVSNNSNCRIGRKLDWKSDNWGEAGIIGGNNG
jgi:hypothetical protein